MKRHRAVRLGLVVRVMGQGQRHSSEIGLENRAAKVLAPGAMRPEQRAGRVSLRWLRDGNVGVIRHQCRALENQWD